jgi:hypothetical protein
MPPPVGIYKRVCMYVVDLDLYAVLLYNVQQVVSDRAGDDRSYGMIGSLEATIKKGPRGTWEGH